jgi:putative ATP-dependent endonuclease of OLD family
MSILIKYVRVSGFRGLENFEIELKKTTVLTGMNNAGKTSLLKALQLALGNKQFVSQDDFFINKNTVCEKIIVDLLIVPIDATGVTDKDFSEDWEVLFTTDRIRTDGIDSFVPLRTLITFDPIKNSYKSQQFILQSWVEFEESGKFWHESDSGAKSSFRFDEVPFFYMDAQRDILEDTKLQSSYLGKMLSKIEYSKADLADIENQIKTLNERAVGGSDILSNIKNVLKELDSAMGGSNESIEITPFTKKVRDLNKGLSIYYGQGEDSFSMEYHGMGTRSWSSLLILKSFISLLDSNALQGSSVFFPILAIEEPEAHLHPNAQKKLFSQINSISGQKLISTHSPYIAASSDLNQIRNMYKGEQVSCGFIDTKSLLDEEIRKIRRQVINTRGEIFFSKFIVFFEGETEEQALPILAEKYFSCSPVEAGIDFVGVGGCGNYLTFIRFAESLNIPWLIFSDAENTVDNNIKANVQQQFQDSPSGKLEADVIVFLDDGNDFEKQMIDDGFSDEIKRAIIAQTEFQNEQHKVAKVIEINAYSDECLYSIITRNKTQFGPEIAEQIVLSGKDLPPKIALLFDKMLSQMSGSENVE